MSTNNYVVYMHTSQTSNKSYIGITNNLDLRTAQHQAPSSGCVAFSRAISKYGWCDFITTILHTNISIDDANKIEAECIMSYNTLAPAGYNLKAGGNVGLLSEETKQRISDSKKGHIHTEETKQRIGEKMKGNTNSTGTRACLTEQHKQRIRDSRLGQKRPTTNVTCPHCGKSGNNAAMHRHHFNNCKLR